MENERNKMVESVFHLTLEILFQLTGEDCTVVKRTSSDGCRAPVCDGWRRPLSPTTGPPPHPRIHEDINVQKILELTNKMMELLTGEAPIRCQDVAVYFSMEEWEYLEGHQDRYKDAMMENRQPLPSAVPSSKRRPPERPPRPLLPQDQQLWYQDKNLINFDDAVTNVTVKEESEQEILRENHPGDGIGSSEGCLISADCKAEDCGITQDTREEPAIIPDIPSAFHSKDLSSDPLIKVASSDTSQTDTQKKSHRWGEHQKLQTRNSSYICPECGKCFSHRSNLFTQRIHTGKKPYSCPECGKCCSQKSNLVNHQRIHTGEKPFSCSECGKCFTQKTALVSHLRSHTGENPFSCSECEKCFIQKSKLVLHQIIHRSEKPFSCPECGKRFNNKSKLAIHQRIHTGEKTFSCSECGKCFVDKSYFVKHQISHTGENAFSCSECGKSYTAKSSLIKHQRTHTGEKSYSCTECGKCFYQKTSLVSHQRSHRGRKTFTCPECRKCFNDKWILIRHQRIHTGEKPFSCPECGKCFNQKSSVITHQRIHTGEKPYSCSECRKGFTKKLYLVNHLKIHTAEKFL